MEASYVDWTKQGAKTFPGLYDLRKIWNPSWFQGNNRGKKYFEGWYIKMVDSDLTNAWAVIPGISLHAENRHAFIQIINGKTGQTWYYRYPLDAFRYSRKGFNIKIGDNYFSRDGVELNINKENDTFKGRLKFIDIHPLSATLTRPGIMGWYRYMPFMECYHGVVSLNHGLRGKMMMNNHDVVFDKGRGYIEKDWGSSMPESWIWMQSNHFERPNTSFMLSVANIPWIGKSFEGFLGFLLLDNKINVFATYTGAKIKEIERRDDGVILEIKTKQHILQIQGKKDSGTLSKGALKAPVSAGMDRVIHENLNAELHIKLTGHSGNLLFEGTGIQAGFEITKANIKRN